MQEITMSFAEYNKGIKEDIRNLGRDIGSRQDKTDKSIEVLRVDTEKKLEAIRAEFSKAYEMTLENKFKLGGVGFGSGLVGGSGMAAVIELAKFLLQGK